MCMACPCKRNKGPKTRWEMQRYSLWLGQSRGKEMKTDPGLGVGETEG